MVREENLYEVPSLVGIRGRGKCILSIIVIQVFYA